MDGHQYKTISPFLFSLVYNVLLAKHRHNILNKDETSQLFDFRPTIQKPPRAVL